MMNKFRIFLWTFASVCLFSACEEEKASHLYDSEELLSFDVSTLEDKEYEIKLSDLMESVEIVQLDSVQEAFTKIFRVAVSDNYFAIHHVNYPVKLYSRKSGKFWGNIGRIGNGPGEYFQIWNVAIEEADNRIYLVNQGRNHIYSYDLNGNFHEDETIHLADGQEFERPYIFADKKIIRLLSTIK